MKKKNEEPKIKLRVIFIYDISIIVAALIFYLLVPIFLNYGPGTINTNFDREMSNGLFYWQQIFLVVSALICIVTILLMIVLKDIDKYKIFIKEPEKYKKEIAKIRKISFNLPNVLLTSFIILPLLCSFVVLFMQTSYLTSSDFKLMLIIFILSTATISIANMRVEKIFAKILQDMKTTSTKGMRKSSIMYKLILQLVSIMAICIVFTYLAISSIDERETAKLLGKYYGGQFENIAEEYNGKLNYNELKNVLLKTNKSTNETKFFIADENRNIIYSEADLSKFFTEYAKQIAPKNDNNIYDYYGTSNQGKMKKIELDNGKIVYIGAYYNVITQKTTNIIMLILVGLGGVCAIIIGGFARNISKNIKEVSNSLTNIANNSENALNQKMYVTSNDEIGDLVQSYNKIQELNKKYVEEIHDSQTALMERERLSTLGQMVGGIAHNLKTPIMSIAGAMDGLEDLIKEYDESIDDDEVTREDHHQIAKEMKSWVDKVNSYDTYMSDVITAVKGQAVNFSDDTSSGFTIEELVKRVSILMKHELKSALVTMDLDIRVDEKTVLKGNVNSLVQVVNNLISNAIQSYHGETNKKINLIIKQEEKNILIQVQDFGSGIPEEVQKRLFNEMVTTKGKNGTGLGLFMSYSTIKGHFNGKLYFESELGKGTTFTISLPE